MIDVSPGARGSCGRMVVLWEHICKWLGEGSSLGSGGWRLGIDYDFFWTFRDEVGSIDLHRTRGGHWRLE